MRKATTGKTGRRFSSRRSVRERSTSAFNAVGSMAAVRGSPNAGYGRRDAGAQRIVARLEAENIELKRIASRVMREIDTLRRDS
jgi:hypothetical protein